MTKSTASLSVRVTKCLTPSHDQCIGEYITDNNIEQKVVVKCDCMCHKTKDTGDNGVVKGCEPSVHTNINQLQARSM